MNFKEITEAYYSQLLGKEGILSEGEGVRFLETPERDRALKGYSQAFDLLGWLDFNRLVISYGSRAKDGIETLKKALDGFPTKEHLEEALFSVYGVRPGHTIKFQYTAPIEANFGGTAPQARVLTKADERGYLSFFKANNPGCKDTGWVLEYFDDMVKDGLCCGVFEDGILVSCTDAPDMPFLADKVQEIGINTRKEFRGRGFAAHACRACAEQILKNGKCPQWSTSAHNEASQRLAEKAGFHKLSDLYVLTLEQ